MVLELFIVIHQTALRMLQEAFHSNRYEVVCRSSNYFSSLCNLQADGSNLDFEEADHAELVRHFAEVNIWHQTVAEIKLVQ